MATAAFWDACWAESLGRGRVLEEGLLVARLVGCGARTSDRQGVMP